MKFDYSIGELSRATGVRQPALRMWEARYGFPAPVRTESGHRRYSEADLAAVQRVRRDRGAGLSLAAAITRARSAVAPGEQSLHVALRRFRPQLAPQLLRKPALDAISRAIEDDFLSRSDDAVLFGAFQRERFYRQAERRWRELSRATTLTAVFADFQRARRPRGAPAEVPLGISDPLNREWAVICDGPSHSACMIGWERPAKRHRRDQDRSFEVIWTVEPEAVREVIRVGAKIADSSMPELRERLPEWLESPATPATAELTRATELANRMVAYLAGA
jgi:DICT domain-containing protein